MRIRTSEEIDVAADSLSIGVGGPDKTLRKIQDLGNGVFVAHAGLNNHEETGFDMPTLVSEIRDDGPRTVLAVFKSAEKIIGELLRKVVRLMRRENRSELGRILANRITAFLPTVTNFCGFHDFNQARC